PGLSQMLSKMSSRFSKGRVFDVGLEAVRSAFRRARADAGLPALRFHDLRHSAASFMVQAGVSLYEVQKVLGHKDARMTQRYAHLTPDHLRGAVAALERI